MNAGIFLTNHKVRYSNLMDIESVETIDPINAAYGTPFNSLGLPSEIDVEFVGGGTDTLPLVWIQGDYSPTAPDVYNLVAQIQLSPGIINTQEFEGEIEVTLEAGEFTLAMDTVVETFTAETPGFFGSDDRRFNMNIEPGMVYDVDTQETIFTNARLWNSTYLAYAMLWKWSSIYGAYPASIDVGEPQAADNHLTPGICKTSTCYCVFQENTHKGNLDWFKVDFDFSKSVKQTTKTGTFSRVGIRKLGTDDFILLHQNGETNMAYTPFDGNTIGTTVEILTHATKRIYASRPYGPEVDNNGRHCIPFSFTEATPGAAFPAKGVLFTYDWETFYNIDETESFNISGGAATLASIADPAKKFIYLGDYNDMSLTVNLSGTTGWDAAGNFFDCTVLPDSNEITTTTFQGGAWVNTVFEPTGTIAGFAATGGLSDSTNTVWAVWNKGSSRYGLFRMVDGSFYKFHSLATSNDGVSWIDLGDVTPGVNQHIYRAMPPLNIFDIPDNVNFPIASSKYVYAGGPAAFGDFYILKSAYGSLQNMSSYSYTQKYNHITEFPNLHVAYESDDVTISSGTTISQLNDKVGARHAIAIGSPQLTSGEIVCNGTSSAFQLNNYVAEFNAFTQRTLIAVARSQGYLFTMSKTTDDNMFALDRLTNLKFQSSSRLGGTTNTLSANGVGSDISGALHIYVLQRDGRAWRWWVDGIEQNKTFSLAGAGFNNLYGLCGGLTTPNRVGIGVLQRSTNVFTALNLTAYTFGTSAYTAEERMKSENFLSDEYGIPITRTI